MPLDEETLNSLNFLKESESNEDERVWSVKERLALASAVIETGREYWPTISRMVQPFAAPRRKDDKVWCSAKECAKEYSKLIETMGPKKRNELGNTGLPLKEHLVKKLTVDRIQELQDDIRREQEKKIALNNLLENLESGKLDENIDELWNLLKENNEFQEFIKSDYTDPNQKDLQSETTEAMTSSIADEPMLSEDEEKPRLVLHLKKTFELSVSATDDNLNNDSRRLSDSDSVASSITDPAFGDGESKYSLIQTSLTEPSQSLTIQKSLASRIFKNLAPCEAWQKRSKLIISNILDDPNSHLFNYNLLRRDDNNYETTILRHIDPYEIRNKLRNNNYLSPEQFEQDVLLMILNALMYYPIDSPSNKIVRNIYDQVSVLFKCLYKSVDCDDNELSQRRITRRTSSANA